MRTTSSRRLGEYCRAGCSQVTLTSCNWARLMAQPGPVRPSPNEGARPPQRSLASRDLGDHYERSKVRQWPRLVRTFFTGQGRLASLAAAPAAGGRRRPSSPARRGAGAPSARSGYERASPATRQRTKRAGAGQSTSRPAPRRRAASPRSARPEARDAIVAQLGAAPLDQPTAGIEGGGGGRRCRPWRGLIGGGTPASVKDELRAWFDPRVQGA